MMVNATYDGLEFQLCRVVNINVQIIIVQKMFAKYNSERYIISVA